MGMDGLRNEHGMDAVSGSRITAGQCAPPCPLPVPDAGGANRTHTDMQKSDDDLGPCRRRRLQGDDSPPRRPLQAIQEKQGRESAEDISLFHNIGACQPPKEDHGCSPHHWLPSFLAVTAHVERPSLHRLLIVASRNWNRQPDAIAIAIVIAMPTT
ncbi:hypothetical protein PCL_07927 [Purpureocillium lilacinum]|uniref:Uncharacterized protein n=1 Tax=Purpureocillium lilacinum TaxID=33203 RepID=A0A2U3EJE7_PURLI|nr:hypothetical protein PCL_07927 [Purpureocillium lilacinum]